MEVAEMKKYCQTMSREIIVKNHNIGIEVIEDLKNVLDLSLCSFTFKVFLVKSESSWMIISDCHGSSSDKTIVGYRPLSSKKFELSPDLKKFVNLNFPTASTMKVKDLPNDLEDGSLSILICLGPLLLRRSLLKFDVFTRYRNVHSVLKKCIVDGKLLHLQPSNFIDSYSTEEERIEFVAIKTKKEIADEKLNLSEAKKFAAQILRNSLLTATTRKTEDVSSLPAPSNFDLESDSSLSSEGEVRGISDKLKDEIAYWSALRAQDNDLDSDFEYPELQHKKRKATQSKTPRVKRRPYSGPKKSASRKIKTSAIVAQRRKKVKLSGSDNSNSGADVTTATSENDRVHTIGEKSSSKFPVKCTDSTACSHFAKEHFHCSNCDKISNSQSVIDYHCKNSSMCVTKSPHRIEETETKTKSLGEVEKGENLDLTRDTPEITEQHFDVRVSNSLYNKNNENCGDNLATLIKVGVQPVEGNMDRNLERRDKYNLLESSSHEACTRVFNDNVLPCTMFCGSAEKKKSCFDLNSNKLFEQFHYHCKLCMCANESRQAVINHVNECHNSAEKDSNCSKDSLVTRKGCINKIDQNVEVKSKSTKRDVGETISDKSKAVGSSDDKVEKIMIACWQTGEHCKIREGRKNGAKHYHCPICMKYSSLNQKRVVEHYKKCWSSQNCLDGIEREGLESLKNDLLHSVVVDDEKCIYLVRGAHTGPGKPVAVQIHPKNMECSSHQCIQDAELAKKSGVNDYYCQHIKSCLSLKPRIGQDDGATNSDLFRVEFLSNNKDISDSDKKNHQLYVVDKGYD